MNKFHFRDRVGILDERSRHFLVTVTWLGGYVTAEQAQELGIRNSVPRVHVQLKDLESCGFIKRISTYPAVYQVTKSVARLMGADFSARRQHAIETIRTRILTVNFYLEALAWPVDFVFNHGRKLSKFGELGCESGLLPQRGGKPYLWQDFVLQRRSGDLAVVMVDHFGRSAQRQLYRFLKRFARCLGFLQDKLRLLVVVGSDARLRVYTRLLDHPKLQRIVADGPGGLASVVKLYRIRRSVPVIRSLEPISRDLRELRALGPLRDPQSHSAQQNGQATHNNASHKDGQDFWIEWSE
ncbi:MAG TPA: hypothetical protein VFC10_00570 [Terriglobia bacterium]|nr:hypothetical protein [Terriglobia bacterium]